NWICWPRIDSASIFAAIVDPHICGRWSILPMQASQVSRHYIDRTNVLETTFTGETGKITLSDFIPVTSEERKRSFLLPDHELLRQVKCDEGKVEVMIDFKPRLDYGRVAPKIKNAGKLGWRI